VRLKELHRKYRDHVEFIVVYVKEAHPTDKWWLGRSRTQRVLHELSGNPARLDVADPVTLEQRRKVAASCQASLFDGHVLYNPGLGPFGFSPDHLETAIVEYLAEG